MKKVLLIGGRGFIGSHLKEALLNKGHEVFVSDREDDIEKSFLISPDLVFNLAGAIGLKHGNNDSGIERAKLIADLAKKHHSKLVFFSSGGAIYNNPESDYAKANLEIEETVKEVDDYLILRLSNVYGPGQWASGIIPQILKGEVVIKGDGGQTRDFIYIDDVVEISILAMNKKGAYNIGFGKVYTLNKVIEIVKKYRSVNVKYIEGDDFKAGPIVSDLGEPKTDLEEGIKKMLDCYLGFSKNDNTRYQCSSGGSITTLLKYLIDSGKIEGAFVAVPSSGLKHQMAFVNNPDDLINYGDSIYCPVDFSPVWRFLKKYPDKKIAVVGLPCNLRALKDYQNIFKIGLFCGGVSSHQALEFLCQRKKIKKVDRIRYRNGGWPGRRIIAHVDDKEIVLLDRDKSFLDKILYSFCFSGPFYLNSCRKCNDHFASFADVSFGDAWLPEVMKSDKVGTNVIIIRSKKGKEYLKEAPLSLKKASFERFPVSRKRPLRGFFQYLVANLPLKLVFILYSIYFPIYRLCKRFW